MIIFIYCCITLITLIFPYQIFSDVPLNMHQIEAKPGLVLISILNFPRQERHNEPPAKTGGADEPGSHAVLDPCPEEADEGNVFAKLRKMVSKPLNHVPSLALDNPLAVDGILRRPYENGVEGREDALADQNDTDSAYEDASAETPERDRLFPGTPDTQELQRDPESSAHFSEDKNQDPKVDQCVVS